jgi:hypothetical protein
MGDDKKPTNKSRRWFLSGGLSGTVKPAPVEKKEMVKMLTADGKLVEVDKAIFDLIAKKQKATNKDIFDWMENPSKKNNS